MNRRFLRTKILEVRARAIPLMVFMGVLIVLIANALATHAQFSSVPVTGFNADIVADGTAGATPGASTTDYVDALASGYVFVSPTFGFGSSLCATTGNALPANNQITSTGTTTNTGITYTLQGYGNGSATNPNALRVITGGTGTLTLATPTNASTLYLVCLGGGGAVTFSVTINYADNTSETVVNPSGGAPDWCGGSASVYKLTSQQYFRINRTSTTCSSDAGNCQYLYEIPVPVGGTNYGKNINSISFSAVSGGILNVMAMGKKAPCTASPAPTALVFGASTTSSVTGSFTASTATGYLVVRYPAGSTPVAPVGGINYTTGTPIGTGKVVSMGTTTTFTATGLSANTSYDVYVYGYTTGTTCGGPVFGTALMGTQITTACGAPTLGTVAGGVRTITVGPTGNTATIGAALADINTNGMNTPTVIELQSNYVSTGETFPITIPASPCFSATNTLTIRPAAGANGLVIKGSNAGATIDFNGANYVILDGRPGGVGSSIATTTSGSLNATNLNIINNNTGGTTIKLDNSAGSNIIEYCDLQGHNTTNASLPNSAAGVVYFDNTGANGNDNNTITYCNIHADSITVFPTLGIYSLGTNVTTGYAITSNDNNTVSNCNIYDYFSASTNSVGLELNYGNSAWTITNNSFFEPSTMAITAAFNRAIWVSPYRSSGNVGNGFTVTNNYIGGSQPLCGGTPYTITTSGYFDGIRMEVNDGTTPATSLVQGNNIKNISITSSSSSDLLHGIATNGASGLVNISNNVIGTIAGSGGAANGGITLSGSASTPVAGHAIFLAGTYTSTVQNNTIANILIPVAGNIFTGIYNTSGGTLNISNNTIGSLTNPQSIYFSDATSVTSTSRYINGMRIAPTVASNYTIANNTIAGIFSNNIYTGSSGQLVGIYVSSSSAANVAMTGNAIRNLYTAANSTGTTTASSLIGICASITGAGTNTVTGNTIDSLVSGATANAVNVMGLYYAGSTSVSNLVSKNFIHSIIAPATATATITGIYVNAGTTTFANNMIRLGINPDGTDYTKAATISGITSATTSANNFYYNSVYVGGNNVEAVANNTFAFRRTATSGTYNVLNNIFVNNRSNAGTTTSGTHFAVYFATSNTGATLNNNLYNTTGTGGIFAYNGTANVASYIPGWIASDGLSVVGNPQFLQPIGTASTVNLHLNTAVGSVAESHGSTTITAITTDFDGDSRSGYSGSAAGSAPDIGADEFAGIYVSLSCAGTPTAGTASASVANICPNVTFSLGLSPVSTVQGLSYQWISSPAGANTWTLLGAAQTTPVYSSASITANTDFRCVVTCTASNLRDTSTLANVVVNSFNTCYCASTATSANYFITLFKTTGAAVDVNKTSAGGTTTTGYSDYTTTDTIKAISNTTINFNGTTTDNGVKIWVDWNHDGDFDDAGEQMFQTGAYVASFSGSFTIPTTALTGYTRLRVKADYFSTTPTACGAISYGETEDYAFYVIAQTACAGAPAPGNTISSVSSLCATGTSNLTLANNYLTSSGINYQWQSSLNGTSWTDLTGLTASLATTPTITQTTSFRCRLICTAGPDTGYSTPVVVTVNPLPTIVASPALGAFCTAGNVSITASGASTYTWSPSTTLSAATGTTVVASPTTITTYTITGTDANGCVNSGFTTVGPIDAFTPVASATNACSSNLPVNVTVSPITSTGGNTEYKITDTLGATIADWQSSTNFTVTPTALGGYKYYVYARNTGCATSISDTGTVTFYVGFGGTVIATNASCANGDGSLIISNPQGPGTGAGVIQWYVNDFSSSTINSTFAALQGAASVTGGALQLTANTTSSAGGILIKNPTAISKLDSVNFTLTIPQNGGADGLSWSYGDITYPTATSYSFESGVGNKLIISFDAYGSTPPGQAGIYLSYGQSNVDGTNASTLQTSVTSTMLAYANNISFTNNTAGKQISISISSDNKLTLKLGGVIIFNAVQLPAAYAAANKSTWQQIIAARTGGVSEQHLIDNLGIYSSSISYSYGASPAHSGTLPTTWQSSPIFGSLSGGDSLDLWVANPTTPSTCNQKLGTFGVTAPVVASFLDSGNPSCVGTDDGYVLVKVNAPGTYNVTYSKNNGNTITKDTIASQNDGNGNEYVGFQLGQGTYTNMRAVNATSNCVSNALSAPITLAAPSATTVAMASSTDTITQPGAGTQFYTDGTCNLIAAVTSPNNLGLVTTSLTVSNTIPASTSGEPFLGRYVEITPSQNGNLPATLKLYFTPADFTAYNASPSVGNASYPAILSDGSNLRIRAFHGVPSSGTTGPNGQYSLTNSDVIQPSSIVFNATGNYWEVSVSSPNGFSGFFANTSTVTPLDIALSDISAVNKGAVNVISWNTKTETAGDRFSLERSKDGRTFSAIAAMPAKGYAPSEYSYTDQNPINGINYYRLILQNVSGSNIISKVVSATVKNGSGFQLAAYPNPAASELTVNVTEVIGKGVLEIVDVTGRSLISKNINSTTNIVSLAGLTNGIYIIKYHDDVHEATMKVNKN